MPYLRASSVCVLAGLILAGCSSNSSTQPATAPATPAVAVANDGRCHSEAAQFTVGQIISQALLEQAQSRSGAQTARALGPQDMVTMDYRSDRLNLNVDSNRRVVRANCG